MTRENDGANDVVDKPSVLVVEDEPSENQFLTLTVRGLGYATDSCLDGQAAIAWLQEHRPSLVFLDALLPKADGFAVLAEIRRLYPETPVYMMSGVYKKKQYEQEAVGKLGASAYLHKPLGVLQVWEILERHASVSSGLVTAADSPGVPFWRRPLPAVVADLWAGGKTGLLFVRATGGSAILFFESGNLVFGRCNDPQLRIDRVLLQLGKISREQLPKVSELAAQARGRVGEALVAEKLITPSDLAEALALQQRNHVSRPLTWTEGTAWFYASDAPRNETFKMQLDLPSLVFWACRHLEVDEHLIRFLPKPDRKVRTRSSGSEMARPFGLSPDEASFVDLADGTRTVAQLRAIGRMMQIDAERLLAGLHALQQLQVSEEEKAPEGRAPLTCTSVPGFGDLSRYTPPLLLVSLALARKTGILQIETPGDGGLVQRTIHFEGGAIAFASSSDAADRIGQVLLRVGLLTREQLQEALAAAQSKPGIVLGRILVSKGYLRPDDLHAALMQQAQQVITGLVGWREGTFRFQDTDGPGRDIVPLGLPTLKALMTALRTCHFADIAPRLPAPQARLRATATAHHLAADLPLTQLEQRMRHDADGSRTVQEIAASAPEGPEAALRAIHALTTVGIIEGFMLPQGAPAPPPRQGLLRPVAPSKTAAAPAASAAGTSGETSGERRHHAALVVEDESFGTPDGEAEVNGEETFGKPLPAHAIKEDWSSVDECSFAGMGDERAPAEDWSDPAEASFADMARDPPAAAASVAPQLPADDVKLPEMTDGDADSLLADLGADFERDIAFGAGPPRARAGGTAVAVAPITWTTAQGAAVAEFLTRLGEWSQICPEAVPESVRAALPAEIRETYGL